MAFFGGAYAAAHYTPVGWAVDGVLIAFTAGEVGEVLADLYEAHLIVDTITHESDFDPAAEKVARLLVDAIESGALALILHTGRKLLPDSAKNGNLKEDAELLLKDQGTGNLDLTGKSGKEFVYQKALNKAKKVIADKLRLRERQIELGNNHEQGGKLDYAEGLGGARYEQATGKPIKRSTEEGADFFDSSGPISLKGPLGIKSSTGLKFPVNQQMIDGLANSVIKDVKTNTYTKRIVVDLLGLTSAQRKAVIETIKEGVGNTKKEIIFLY